jgi:plastocyanin
MRRAFGWVVVMFVAAALGGPLAAPAGASGGGGCGRPVSDAAGTSVRIREFCFLPTILRVRPGQAVVFENRDSFPHVVLGANAVWGSFGQVRGGHDVTYRFTRPGIYPYVCTYHPGMVGAVVVGHGQARGEAHAAATAAGPVVAVMAADAAVNTATAHAILAEVGTATASTPTSSGWYEPWQLVALSLLVAAVLAFIGVERRRRGPAIA